MKESDTHETSTFSSSQHTDELGDSSCGTGRFTCPQCGAPQSFLRVECTPIAVRCPSCKIKVRIRLPKFRSFTLVLIAILPLIYLIGELYFPDFKIAVLVSYIPLMLLIDLLVSFKWGQVEKDGS